MEKPTPSYCLYCGLKLGQRRDGFPITDGKLMPASVRKRVRQHAESCPKWPKGAVLSLSKGDMPYYLSEREEKI